MPVQPRTEKDPEPDSRGKRLESWKEIAGYLNRHVTTIRRWEKREGLPAHRHRHAKLGSIYAYTRELDVWFEGRRAESDDPGAATAAASASSERPPPPLLWADGAREAVHLTGREEEIKRLRSSWERAARGHLQIAVVTANRESERRDSSWNLRGPLPDTRQCWPDIATARRSSPMRRG